MCAYTSIRIYINTETCLVSSMMKRYNVAMTEEMEKKLETERKKRLLDSIPETIRVILSEYLSKP